MGGAGGGGDLGEWSDGERVKAEMKDKRESEMGSTPRCIPSHTWGTLYPHPLLTIQI